MVPDTCPNCGADVPTKAKACPECGSDEKTGWSDDANASRLGLSDEEFDYEGFVKATFEPPRLKPLGISWHWWLTAILLIILLTFIFLRW
jgi:hypothetical protein